MGDGDRRFSGSLSRRALLARTAAVGAGAVAASAFTGYRAVASQTAPASFQEAPILAEQVAAGTLPPLEERLPLAADIMVVEPIEEIGQYGGTWRRAFTGTADFHAYGRCVYEQILRWPRDPTQPIGPGIAKEWEFS
ncbi:MAG: ABC transporter substrate-binding protein, partial [Thermomicrobiales bacterium]